MSSMSKHSQLEKRRQEIQLGGGKSALESLKAVDKLSARDRIDQLLDHSSFVESGGFVTHRSTDFNMETQKTPADGVVTGYGTIAGNLVYVYSQDPTVMGGSLGEMHAKKIAQTYDEAMKMGAPIIGFLDSSGIRLQESMDALNGYGVVFTKQSRASGVIPQITIITGDCAGGAGAIPRLSDFTLMASKNARLFLNSPNTFNESATFDQIATANIHATKSGHAHFAYDTEEECINTAKVLLSYLPANNLEDPPLYASNDDLNRVDSEIMQMNMENIIASIADDHHCFEIQKDFAPNVKIGFIRLNGTTVGVVANESQHLEGKLDLDAMNKVSRFVGFCDGFNIPVLTLTDVDGFISEVEGETAGVLSASAKMIDAFARATVPKINVLVGKAYGSAYVAMNSKHIGADFVYAWATASIGIMPAESAVHIMYGEEIMNASDQAKLKQEKMAEFDELQTSTYAAAEKGYVDDIIDPAETRKRLIAAFEILSSKRESMPMKKHSTL